jgi:hypothetical protein
LESGGDISDIILMMLVSRQSKTIFSALKQFQTKVPFAE